MRNVHSRSSSPSQRCLLKLAKWRSEVTLRTRWGSDENRCRCRHKNASSVLRIIPLFWVVKVKKFKSRLALFKHHRQGECVPLTASFVVSLPRLYFRLWSASDDKFSQSRLHRPFHLLFSGLQSKLTKIVKLPITPFKIKHLFCHNWLGAKS